MSKNIKKFKNIEEDDHFYPSNNFNKKANPKKQKAKDKSFASSKKNRNVDFEDYD